MVAKEVSTDYERDEINPGSKVRFLNIRVGVSADDGENLWESAYYFEVGYKSSSGDYVFKGAELDDVSRLNQELVDIEPGLGHSYEYRFTRNEEDIEDVTDPQVFVDEVLTSLGDL